MSRLWTIVERLCILRPTEKGGLALELRSRFLHNVSY
jgi:hypothetical protein